ncbi:MAG: bifunctional oligoribonuclease/PAP phosphatase NrnA [Bacilli bacterium]
MKKIYKQIVNQIKKYDTIVIARHVGPDPDALASQIALKEIIKQTYPTKKVYAIGHPASKFKYIGMLDKFDDSLYENSLLIVVDLANLSRLDGVEINKFDYTIKIDHHPFIEQFCHYEWIDNQASSASQMLLELVFNSQLKMNKETAEKLFLGVVSDTNRFLFSYSTSKTFNLIANLIEKYDIDITKQYKNLYLTPFKETKFFGYIANNLTITENGFAYMKITNAILNEYNVDEATAGNMVNNFNYIHEIIAWALFTEDLKNNNIRGSIRSRGPIINKIAEHYNGGGHIYACGVRLKNFDESDLLINELDKVCMEYNN